MRFERFANIPSIIYEHDRYDQHMAEIKEHWRSLGWEQIPEEHEAAIKAAWISHLEPSEQGKVIPKPFRVWRGQALARHREQPELEGDFTLKLLAAFRFCTKPGERLWVIDWPHPWYYFNPHGGITVATRDEWAKPVLPDGDSYNYVAPDFRFGIVMSWRVTGPVTLFGDELLTAFEADPPEQFMRVCGPGRRSRPDQISSSGTP